MCKSWDAAVLLDLALTGEPIVVDSPILGWNFRLVSGSALCLCLKRYHHDVYILATVSLSHILSLSGT